MNFTKLQKEIAKYNAKRIWLSRLERDFIVGIMVVAFIYFGIHFIVYLVR